MTILSDFIRCSVQRYLFTVLTDTFAILFDELLTSLVVRKGSIFEIRTVSLLSLSVVLKGHPHFLRSNVKPCFRNLFQKYLTVVWPIFRSLETCRRLRFSDIFSTINFRISFPIFTISK